MQSPSTSQENVGTATLEKIGFIMGTHYEIITLCLSNLPTKSLPSVATVCKSWNHVVQDLRKKRTKLQIIAISKENITHSLPRISSVPDEFYSRYIQENMQPLAGTLSKFCIAVATKRLGCRVGEKKLHAALQKALPYSCCSILAVCEGIICSADDSLVDVVYRPPKAAFAAVSFPEIPGVSTHIFFAHQLDRRTLSHKFELYQDGQYKPVDRLSRDVISSPVKCALLFTTDNSGMDPCSAPQALCNFIKESQSEDFAYGGCLVKKTSIPNFNDAVRSSGILFCGDNLQTASIVITEDDVESKIDDKILQLKSCDLPLKNSVAFMCSCVGRPDLGIETLAFTRHFPNTPLIGVVGNGEIGHNYLPKFGVKTASVQNSSQSKLSQKVEHSYSSVIVLLSWNINN